MSKLQELRNAANEASEKAVQKVAKLDTDQFQELISNLKKDGVDSDTIIQLESTIKDATKRNEMVTKLVTNGGNVGKKIIKILSNII